MSNQGFTRIKSDRSFLDNLIKAGSKELYIEFSDFDVISTGWNFSGETYKLKTIIPERSRKLNYFKLIKAFISNQNIYDEDFDWSSTRKFYTRRLENIFLENNILKK